MIYGASMKTLFSGLPMSYRPLSLAIVVALVGAVPVAEAQQRLEEVIVTAQRRAETYRMYRSR